MDDQFMEDRLREIESMDPYWQKLEWIKMQEDNPDLFKTMIEFKKERGDYDVQDITMSFMQIAGLIFILLLWLFIIYISVLDE